MKKIILSLVMVFVLIAAAGCSLKSGDTIKFTSLPQPVYTQGYSVDAFKNEVKVSVNGYETSLANAQGIIVSGLDFETVGTHTLVVVYNSVSLTFDYQVVAAANTTKVATASELEAALKNKKPVIELTADITSAAQFKVLGSVSIYGNGYSIYVNNDSRVLHVENLTDATVSLYDLGLICTGQRSFNIISCTNVKVIIDNCKLQAESYCIKLCGGNEKLNVNIKNGSVATGWAAIESYANNSVINVENVTLKGINKHSGDTNNFATIVIDGNGYWGSAEGEMGCNSTYTFNNVTIEAEALGEASQSAISIQYKASLNKVHFNNCNININQQFATEAGSGNQVFVDGVEK